MTKKFITASIVTAALLVTSVILLCSCDGIGTNIFNGTPVEDTAFDEINISSDHTSEVSPESAYKEILDMYYAGISCNWTNCDGEGWKDVGDPDNVCYIISQYEADSSLSDVGYCLLDINADGQSELFICMLDYHSRHIGAFYDLYTIANGEIVHVISAGERDRYNLAEDYSINNDGSFDGHSGITMNYSLDKTDGTLQINRALIHDYEEDSENPYFDVTTDYYDWVEGEIGYDDLTHLSNDEASALLDSLPENIPLDLTPFDEYTPDSSSSEERYQAYAELIEKYESQYGVANVHEVDDWFSYMSGLCFMKLVDFRQNGQEDLLLVYETDVSYGDGHLSHEYTFEVWSFQDNELVMLDSGGLFGTDGGVTTVYLAEYNDNIYLVTGGADAFEYYYYHGYSNGEFGIVREAKLDWDEGAICSIDGVDVTYEEFEAEQEKWFENTISYGLNFDCDNVLLLNKETKKALSLPN